MEASAIETSLLIKEEIRIQDMDELHSHHIQAVRQNGVLPFGSPDSTIKSAFFRQPVLLNDDEVLIGLAMKEWP